MVRKELDIGLDQLKDELVEMGEHVERALGEAMIALQTLDTDRAKKVIAEDRKLNELEEHIDQLGARIIATQAPVAKDLRRILTAFKMATDLERMGDLSVDIAKIVLQLDGQTLVKPLVDLPHMAELTQQMIYESIQCFIQENVDLAYKMAKDDDEVDALLNQIITDLYHLMVKDPTTVAQASQLSFASRYIERIADHATNIGESVVYLVLGKRPDLNL
ncbi:phosphate transport system protein [Paenibacillus phyllosphaerae]|uniref:Phosphate-specific transport system accessory protein PhoU n=1 Tax=Paenibacillus phyllosphaerae TaxID=274593 RepID=A0A7W5FM05_9BACL|nr:phosphate signaling complex protein PhoU [Paenibacillus phyllosphaerae]MBB3109572.1 phosphate transport system protein [Paenibacillus phyllosphaerae]